jgi:hypothetical protein
MKFEAGLQTLWLLLLFKSYKSSEPNLSPNQFNALWDFYNSTNGKYWNWHNFSATNEKWDFTNPSANPCYDNWQGVKCSCGLTCALTHLELPNYNLTGTLPLSIGEWNSIESFNLTVNKLTRAIPNIFGNWTILSFLDLSVNELTGYLPPSTQLLISLTALVLNNNHFFGTLPELMDDLVKLEVFNTIGNLFSGTIEALSGLRNLKQLKLNRNGFYGSCGAYLQSNNDLEELLVGYNFFSGSIPFNNNWDLFLTNYYIESNLFTSSIPNGFSQFSALQYFLIANNYICSSVNEDHFMNSFQLIIFNVSFNFLSGILPSNYSNLGSLTHLFVNNNFLTGTIPASLSACDSALVFSFSSNEFSGTIPTSLNKLKLLEQFFIDGNKMSGSIANNTFSPSLINIDLSINQFTGQLDANYFKAHHSLQTFALSENCLSGSIPDSICDASELTTLQLSGLTNAQNCRIYFFGRSTNTNAFEVNPLQGSFPACVFSMPKLQSLSLSGNSFTGTFPSNLNISASLSVLDLSHNRLIGTIPDAIQQKRWSSLDLSSNYLSGTLSNNFGMPINGTLYLEVNKLSGYIPSVVHDIETINILRVNMFACASTTELPPNDPNYIIYSCGSNRVNNTIYSWIAFFGVFVIVYLLFVFRYRQLAKSQNSENLKSSELASSNNCQIITGIRMQTIAESDLSPNNEEEHGCTKENQSSSSLLTFSMVAEMVIKWMEELQKQKARNPKSEVSFLLVFFQEIRKISMIIMLVSAIGLIPIYAILALYWKSFVNSYSWMISGVLLGGEAPAIILFFLLTSFTALIFLLLKNLLSSSSEIVKDQIPADQANKSTNNVTPKIGDHIMSNSELFVARVIIIIFTISVIGAVDLFYVFLELNFGASSNFVAVVGVGLACFRVVTNYILFWKAIPYTSQLVVSLSQTFFPQQRTSQVEAPKVITENPLTLEAPVGIDYVQKTPIKQNHEETESYHFTTSDISFLERLMLINNVVIPILSITVVFPSCLYNLLFAPSNISSSYNYESCLNYNEGEISSLFCEPVTSVSSFTPAFTYSYICSAETVIYYSPVYITNFLIIGFVLPLKNVIFKLGYDKYYRDYGPDSKLFRFCDYWLAESLRNLVPEKPIKPRLLFKKLILTTQLSSSIAIILIFGALFPPVAISGCMSIITMTYAEELMIGRLLFESSKQGISWYQDKLEKDCEGIAKSLNLSLRSTIFFACILFTFVLFDAYGSTAGWRATLPLALTMCMFPLLLGASYQLYVRSQRKK